MSGPFASQAGLSLAEILVALFIVVVGLTSIAGGFQYALSGVEVGRKQTEAAFLAEQKLEQIKAEALHSYPSASAYPSETYGTIVGYPNHRRTVTITDNPQGVLNTKRVRIAVFYTGYGADGVARPEREVRLDALLARRK